VVFDTNDEAEALVVRGLLETAGIASLITTLDGPQDVLAGVGGMVLRVNPEDAADAKQIIAEYRNNPENERQTIAEAGDSSAPDPIAS
jgi:hypothetical protein